MNSDFKAITSIASFRIISLGLSVINSLLMVYLFGTSNGIEVWFLSHLIFNSFLSVSQTGLISELTLPTYIRIKREGKIRKANKFYSYLINLTFTLGMIAVIVVFVANEQILEFLISSKQEINSELSTYSLIISSLIPFTILNINLVSLLNANEIYGKTEGIKLIKQIISIVSILLFSKKGVISLFVPFVLGIFLELCYLLYCASKTDFRYFLTISLKELNVNFKLRKVSFSTVLYSFSNQIFNIFLNKNLLYLGQVYFVSYSYVINLFKALRSTTLYSIKTVFLTSFSRNIMNFHNVNKKSKLIDKTLGLIIIGIVVNSDLIIKFLWSNPEYGKESVEISYRILAVLCSLFILDLISFFAILKIKVEEKFYTLLKYQSFIILIFGSVLILLQTIEKLSFFILLTVIILNNLISNASHILLDRDLINNTLDLNRISFYTKLFIIFFGLKYVFTIIITEPSKLYIFIFGLVQILGFAIYFNKIHKGYVRN